MLTARQVVRDFFTAYPKLAKKSPEEIVKVISGNIEAQARDNYSGGELSALITIDYIRSNIRGYYYCIVCDICRAKCRKAYVKKVVIANNPSAKVLCGKCAGIRYKRKTEEEKRALACALKPELMEEMLKSGSVKQNLIAIEAFHLRRQLEEKGERIAEKVTGSLPPEIIE